MTFTDEQEVVINRSGSFFVDACPGAGKTHAVVERFLKRPTAPDRRGIALLSFTNAASDEVIARTVRNPDLQLAPNFIGTIDRFANRYIVGPLLAAQTGVRPTLRDKWASIPKTEVTVTVPGGPPLEISMDAFDYSLTGDARLIRSRLPYDDRQQAQRLSESQLNTACRRAAARFDTLTKAGYISCAQMRAILTAELTKADRRARIGELLASRFYEVIIDEVQDCNPSDIELLQLFYDAGIGLVLVGDLEQSIYGFRSAEPNGVAAFTSTFGDPVQLTGNFRSSPAICKAVSSLRSSAKVDVAVGRNRENETPVYLLFESNLDRVRTRLASLLDAHSVTDDVLYIAHGEWAAKAAAGVPKEKPTRNRLCLIAKAAHRFATPSATARLQALTDLQTNLFSVVRPEYEDLPDDELCEQLDISIDTLRSGLISVASAIDATKQSPAEALGALKSAITALGWNWLDTSRLRTPPAWPLALNGSDNVQRSATIHAQKGRQVRAAVVVMTKAPGNGSDSSYFQWRDGQEGEARRTLYVGASRAEEVLVLVATRRDQADCAIRALRRDQVPFEQVP